MLFKKIYSSFKYRKPDYWLVDTIKISSPTAAVDVIITERTFRYLSYLFGKQENDDMASKLYFFSTICVSNSYKLRSLLLYFRMKWK